MKTFGVVVGHRKSRQGACNVNSGATEFTFNSELAEAIRDRSHEFKDINIEVIYRDDTKGGYIYLPAKINDLDIDYVVSLHCNAYKELPGQREASGTETLYHYNSTRGYKMAGIFQKYLADYLLLPNRGLRSRRAKKEKPDGWEEISIKGGHLLKYTDEPCIITEAIFIDNDQDFARASLDIYFLAGTYLRAMEETVEKGI